MLTSTLRTGKLSEEDYRVTDRQLRALLGVEPGEHLVAGGSSRAGGFVSHFSSPSKSRLSSRTRTAGSPRNHGNGCEVWRATTART